MTSNMEEERILQEQIIRKYGEDGINRTEIPGYLYTSLNPSLVLRPYQESCFKFFIKYWEEFRYATQLPHLLFRMATGSGKTLIMAGLILYLYDKGYRNFLYFVNSNNVIEKTKINFFEPSSSKYLFASTINIGQKQVQIKQVKNFQSSEKDCINICLTTTQSLHIDLNNPKENSLSYEDFGNYNFVLISDEAHHINTATKKGKLDSSNKLPGDFEYDSSETEDWESTVLRIFNTPNDKELPNVLLEFTATMDLENKQIYNKYRDKLIFDYDLKQFCKDGYSKDIELVQSSLQKEERIIQAVILNQFKLKLFASISQNIKPVILFKSKTQSDNKNNYNEFIHIIKYLSTEQISTIRNSAKGDIMEAFKYFELKGITDINLIHEIQEDFDEEKLIIIDGNNISPEKQQIVNTLEDRNNLIRAVFAVDMLNEGWDVLNLYDIVRLYSTRDARNGKPGKTTIKEAQLIGRGARYFQFKVPNTDVPANKRKFDKDLTNPLRIVEKLHYHSETDSKYIQELKSALISRGLIQDNPLEVKLELKENFKKTDLYNKGYIFVNERLRYCQTEQLDTLGDDILKKEYTVTILSGQTSITRAFDNSEIDTTAPNRSISILLKDLGENVVRSAINRFDQLRYDNLTTIYPKLKSIKEFVNSEKYLSNIHVRVYSSEKILNNLIQENKLYIAIEVLKQIVPMIIRQGEIFTGSVNFKPLLFKNVFKNHIMKIAITEDSDKEKGKSMKFNTNYKYALNLDECDWYAYNDCYGTAEEKALVKYVDSIYTKLKDKYERVYLVRNEQDCKLFSFDDGQVYEPDYVLFLRKKNSNNIIYDNIQIFIEPKGRHLILTDAWKEKNLQAIHDKAVINFSTRGEKFNIWGLPFFTLENEKGFQDSLNEIIDE